MTQTQNLIVRGVSCYTFVGFLNVRRVEANYLLKSEICTALVQAHSNADVPMNLF
jgi:hypothetical protein